MTALRCRKCGARFNAHLRWSTIETARHAAPCGGRLAYATTPAPKGGAKGYRSEQIELFEVTGRAPVGKGIGSW